MRSAPSNSALLAQGRGALLPQPQRIDDGALILLVAFVALAPVCIEGRHLWSVLTQIGIAVILCQSYALLWGQAGILSFGHAVYAGVGAYAAAGVLRAAEQGAWVPPVVAVPLLGGLAAGGVAALFGALVCRHAGMTLAMITLGLGELVSALSVALPEVFGGEAGRMVDRTAARGPAGLAVGSAKALFVLVGIHVVASALFWRSITRSRWGLLWRAVRDNPARVAFLGGRPARLRWGAWVWGCSWAGVAGALSMLQFEVVSPEVFSSHRSTLVLLFVVLGGTAGLMGPVLAGVALVLTQSVLSAWTPAWSLYVGLAFVLVVWQRPEGLAGAVASPRPRLGKPRERSGYVRHGFAALTLLGAAVWIERVHRMQQRAIEPDPVLHWGDWTLHWLSPEVAWVGGVWIGLGAVGWLWSSRRSERLRKAQS